MYWLGSILLNFSHLGEPDFVKGFFLAIVRPIAQNLANDFRNCDRKIVGLERNALDSLNLVGTVLSLSHSAIVFRPWIESSGTGTSASTFHCHIPRSRSVRDTRVTIHSVEPFSYLRATQVYGWLLAAILEVWVTQKLYKRWQTNIPWNLITLYLTFTGNL